MMVNAEIDPVIARLADPQWLAARTQSLFRYHRPSVESASTPTLSGTNETDYREYDIDMAAWDALFKNSLHPAYSLALANQVARLALRDIPNYETIMEKRRQKAEKLRLKSS